MALLETLKTCFLTARPNYVFNLYVLYIYFHIVTYLEAITNIRIHMYFKWQLMACFNNQNISCDSLTYIVLVCGFCHF